MWAGGNFQHRKHATHPHFLGAQRARSQWRKARARPAGRKSEASSNASQRASRRGSHRRPTSRSALAMIEAPSCSSWVDVKPIRCQSISTRGRSRERSLRCT